MNVIKKIELEEKIKNETNAIGCYIFLLLIIGVPSLLTTIIFSSKVALVITLSIATIVLIMILLTVNDIKRNKLKLKELDCEKQIP